MELLAALIIGAAFWLWTARSSRNPSRAVRTSQAELALVGLGAGAQPPARVEQRPAADPGRTPADRPRRPRPITLGVAVVLQLAALCVTCLLGALLVLRVQLDTRAELRALEQRASERVAKAEAASERAQAELRGLQGARRVLDDQLFGLQARLSQLEQQCGPVDRPARATARVRRSR